MTSSHFLPCRWTNVHNFLKTPSHFTMRLVRLLDRWNLSTCGICHNITFKLQGRLVLALILVQLQKGDSVAASKVSLTKLFNEQLSRRLSLINVSGLAAVGWLLWWRAGSGCKLFGPGEICLSKDFCHHLCIPEPALNCLCLGLWGSGQGGSTAGN